MPHMIESMFYAGTPPWHGLGTAVEFEVTSADAIKLAGLDWTVETIPVHIARAAGIDGQITTTVVPKCRAVVRSSDNKPLGIVGDRYVPIQNAAAFAFFDQIVGEGRACYHTAGSLDEGRRVWLLAKLPSEIRVRRMDVTEKFILLTNSHDGSAALRMMLTPIRVVCQNTLNIALGLGKQDGIAIRHTASATTRVDEARRAIGIADWYYAEFERQATMLSETRFTDAQMKTLAEQLLPQRAELPSSRVIAMREKVVDLFENGRGHELIRGTAWAALNAVGEFADHHRSTRTHASGSKDEARLASAWFGAGAALKQRAHELIVRQLAA
jgi:phage/plasmid-like protein (TIGR03299 family)